MIRTTVRMNIILPEGTTAAQQKLAYQVIEDQWVLLL